MFSFKRPALAAQFCEALSGNVILDAKSGMFLAAPRGVGKSIFLREDLVPEVIRRGWLPIYVDLRADRDADPSLLISDAIKSALTSLDCIPESVTLTNALERLNVLSGKPIVLIIDEAQHALESSTGINSMFGLKAARDYLNRSDESPKLMLVFSGSNQEKLAHLLKHDQPFYGASVTPFPLLGIDFINEFTSSVNTYLADNNQLSSDAVLEAFKLVGHRPEMLRTILGQVAIDGESKNLRTMLKDKTSEFHRQVWNISTRE